MAETIKSDKETKQRILYLTLVLGSCYLLLFIALFGNKGSNNPIYHILQKGFTAFPVLAAIITVLISAVFIPIHLLELGEEIGWREYLLPKQIARYGTHRAVLLNGILWGFAHLPLIYFGFNYSSENPGAPGAILQ